MYILIKSVHFELSVNEYNNWQTQRNVEFLFEGSRISGHPSNIL